MRLVELPLAATRVSGTRRTLRKLEELKQSISEVGLLNPITVTTENVLVAGYHRLEACRALGWETIPAVVMELTDIDAEMAEITENLMRNELNPLERGEQYARLQELREARYPETTRGVAGGIASGASRRKEERTTAEAAVVRPFTEEVSDKTGISSRVIREEIQIAKSIVPEVKDMIRDTVLADRKDELLRLARLEPETQNRVVEKLAFKDAKTVTEAKRQIMREDMEIPPPVQGKYRVIYADPPWNYGNKLIEKYGGAEKHYPSLTTSEICALAVGQQGESVSNIVEQNAVLFLWATAPLLEDALQVMRAWGFQYKAQFVWDKVKHNFGHYNSVRHELLLIGTRGSCLPEKPVLYDSVISIERSERHSEKPEDFRALIDDLYPSGSRIELFARKRTGGWDVWGNQV